LPIDYDICSKSAAEHISLEDACWLTSVTGYNGGEYSQKIVFLN